ncbi:MAG TPA: rhamnogalacturonan acetylesterase [Acholeplasma sp.]|jgi:lysophospholipase L1-like esterase
MNIHIIGDSTAAKKTKDAYPETGWGEKLHLFLNEEITILNHALNGRSSKSFMDEGHFEKMLESVMKDDVVLIQFGHNDEKYEDKTRYTNPYTDYVANLTFMVNKIKSKGAMPIILSSVSRRYHLSNHRVSRFAVSIYPTMAKFAAKINIVPFIDMFYKSKRLYEYLGKIESRKLFNQTIKEDNTHFNQLGAIAIASLVAEGLLNTPISDVILPNSLLRNVDVKRLAKKY